MDPMKIEHPQTKVESSTLAQPDQAALPARTTTGPSSDSVRLSLDGQLAERALRAASADDDRSSAVDRVRDLHARGALSVDAELLADRMIGALLHSDDDRS